MGQTWVLAIIAATALVCLAPIPFKRLRRPKPAAPRKHPTACPTDTGTCARHQPPQGVMFLGHDLDELVDMAAKIRWSIEAQKLNAEQVEAFEVVADNVLTSCRWLAAHTPTAAEAKP